MPADSPAPPSDPESPPAKCGRSKDCGCGHPTHVDCGDLGCKACYGQETPVFCAHCREEIRPDGSDWMDATTHTSCEATGLPHSPIPAPPLPPDPLQWHPPAEPPHERIARLERERDGARADYFAVQADLVHTAQFRDMYLAKVEALTQAADTLAEALRDLIDAIPEETLVADPPLRAWVVPGEAALSSWDALKERR